MDRRILDIVKNTEAWKDDAYKLAALVAAEQQQLDREKLQTAGMPEAAEVL